MLLYERQGRQKVVVKTADEIEQDVRCLSIFTEEDAVKYLRVHPWSVISTGPTNVIESAAETRVSLFRILFEFPRAASGIKVCEPVKGRGSATIRKHNCSIVMGDVSLSVQKVASYCTISNIRPTGLKW